MLIPPPKLRGDISGGGTFLEGHSSYFQDPKSSCVRQPVLVKPYKVTTGVKLKAFVRLFPWRSHWGLPTQHPEGDIFVGSVV